MMNKYMFVANSSWYVNNFRKNTIQNFDDVGEVVVLSPLDTTLNVPGMHVPVNLSATGTNPVKELASLFSIFNSIRLSKPNIVFSFNPKTNLYSMLACAILRVPIVINVSGVGSASQLKGVVGYCYKKMLKLLMKSSSHIFFQNSSDYSSFSKSGYIDDVATSILPGSGVDLKVFTYQESAKRNNSFLVAARLIKQKGIVEYLNASSYLLERYPSFKFKLAGVKDISNRAVSERLIKKNESIKGFCYLGMRSDMHKVLQEVDCVVLPSYYPEGTPRSLLEAAAAGKVIITTDTPGCRDVVIEGVNGFLVPPRDTEALKEAMEKVINLSDEKLAEMQANSRKLAEEKFDEQYVIQRYLDVAEEILAKKSKK